MCSSLTSVDSVPAIACCACCIAFVLLIAQSFLGVESFCGHFGYLDVPVYDKNLKIHKHRVISSAGALIAVPNLRISHALSTTSLRACIAVFARLPRDPPGNKPPKKIKSTTSNQHNTATQTIRMAWQRDKGWRRKDTKNSTSFFTLKSDNCVASLLSRLPFRSVFIL